MPTASQFSPVIAYDKSAIIASSSTTSSAVDLSGTTLCGLFIPAAFNGTTITFQGAYDPAGTFSRLRDLNGNIITATITAGEYTALDPSLFAGIQHLKIVSSASEAAQRSIQLSLRSL